MGQWPERVWFVVLVLLIASNPAQVGAILLHLIREGLLRATEFSCNGTVGDALRVILPKLDDGIGLRIKLTQSGKELLQQHAVGDDFLHRLTAVGNIVAEGAVAIRERLIQRSDVARRMIFAADAVAVTFPYEAVRTHAPAVILLFVADTVSFLIKGIVLFLGDRYLLAGAANVDEIGLLIVVVLHNESPPSAFAEMESSRHAKPDHRREGIPRDYSISAAPHFR